MTYKNHRLRSIFTCITKRDFLKLKEYFLVKPEDVNIVIDEKVGYTPFLFTIKTNYPKAALFLISKGADINQTDIHGVTSLMYAVQIRLLDICKAILDKSPSLINAETKIEHYTALWYAVLNLGRFPKENIVFAIFDLLLGYGADLFKPTSNKMSPFDLIQNQVNRQDIMGHINEKYPSFL
jgi:ankyrin repeat protein